MRDRMLIEGVCGETALSSRNGERILGHKLQQKTLATAVRAFAFDRLVNLALGGELHGTAVTASRLHCHSDLATHWI